MPAEDRDALAAELKRAFASLPNIATKTSLPTMAAEPRSLKSPKPGDEVAGSISFTMPLLRAVLAGQKTQTRRPVRPVPSHVVDNVPIGSDGAAVAPLFSVDGRLWVREKWARLDDHFAYAIDEPSRRVRWNSSRFMPRTAARHFLLVEKIAVARLCAINDDDASREGAGADSSSAMFGPRAWFLSAWDAIYGDGEFASRHDPWVWVIDFRLDSLKS